MKELIVDGYNALHALERYAHSLDSDLEQARDGLVRELSEHAVAAEVNVTVIFDAHKSEGTATERVVDGVRVIFGTKKQSADHLIERRTYEATRGTARRDVVVATNDRLIGDVVSSMGAAVISIATLDGDLRRDYGKERSGSPARTPRLEDDMDAQTRAAFERMRRGIPEEPGPP
jgi:predicted RNA-binding protein with PIN domain